MKGFKERNKLTFGMQSDMLWVIAIAEHEILIFRHGGKCMETNMAIFRGRQIRKTIYNNEWWFVIADVVSVLTDSVDPAGYIKDMRRRDEELSKGWGQIATPLSIQTDGGPQKMNCANTEGIFRGRIGKKSCRVVSSPDIFCTY
jgi:hypothetical protein